MNQRTKTAFMDELLNIEQERVKTAAFMRDVSAKAKELATRAATSMRAAPKAAGQMVQGAADNAGRALGAFATPRQSASEGLAGRMNDFQQAGSLSRAWQVGNLANELRYVFPKEDPSGAGRSRLHRGLHATGNQIGGLIAHPFGITGSIVGTTVGGKVGDAAGRLVDRIRGYRRPLQQQWALPQQGV